jgi:hypothetical protein
MNDKRIIVGRLFLENHPTAANLQVGTINGHKVVVGRHYDNGVLGFFIPDGSIISEKLSDEMWVKGRLSGNKKNRVKAKEIEGVFSEGLFYGSCYFTGHDEKNYHFPPRWESHWVDGLDITEEMKLDIS